MSNKDRESGAASLLVDLSDSVVTVYHGADQDEVLARGRVNNGDWVKLCNYMRDEMGLEWVS